MKQEPYGAKWLNWRWKHFITVLENVIFLRFGDGDDSGGGGDGG